MSPCFDCTLVIISIIIVSLLSPHNIGEEVLKCISNISFAEVTASFAYYRRRQGSHLYVIFMQLYNRYTVFARWCLPVCFTVVT